MSCSYLGKPREQSLCKSEGPLSWGRERSYVVVIPDPKVAVVDLCLESLESRELPGGQTQAQSQGAGSCGKQILPHVRPRGDSWRPGMCWDSDNLLYVSFKVYD